MTAFKFRLFILMVVLVAVTCFAQERSKVSLSGTVVDPQGAVISNAKINIKPSCHCSDCPDPRNCTCCPDQVAVVSDSSGNFRVSVVPGTYKVTAEVRGFGQQEVTVTVRAQAEQHVRIQMK